MNSRSGQASTFTKSRVALSWQKSVFAIIAINTNFTISPIQWPPRQPPNPNPVYQPVIKPEAKLSLANTSQPANNPSNWQKSTFAIKPSFTIQASDDDLPPPVHSNPNPLPAPTPRPSVNPKANPGLPDTSQS